MRFSLLFLLFCLPLPLIVPQESPGEDDLSLVWRYAAGGKISLFPAQGPGGNLYIIADDRALHAIDPETGKRRWIYRPRGRLKNLLMAAPDGTIYIESDREELFAVTPGGTGRWKLPLNGSLAALPAAAPDGRIFLSLKGGDILGISRKGRILWTRKESAEAASAPVAAADGTAWFPLTDGRLTVLDGQGQLQRELALGTALTVLALDGQGRLWGGSRGGRLFIIDVSQGEVLHETSLGDERVVSLLTSPDGGASAFLADGTLVWLDGEGQIKAAQRGLAAGGAPSAGESGRLYLPAADGTLRVRDLEGKEQILSVPGILGEPLLTQGGLLVAGGGDWILYAWKAEAPGSGWRQFRGGPGRTGAFFAPPPLLDRETARQNVGFYIRERTARQGEAEERLALAREIAAYPDDASLYQAMPWASLLLEDLARGGLLLSLKQEGLPYDNAALVRSEAYTVLARGEDFRIRGLLAECVRRETDPFAAAAGFAALGEIGSDWDGLSTRIVAERYQTLVQEGGDTLALAAARALKALIVYNGEIPDPAGFALVETLLTAPLQPAAREEILGILRESMERE